VAPTFIWEGISFTRPAGIMGCHLCRRWKLWAGQLCGSGNAHGHQVSVWVLLLLD